MVVPSLLALQLAVTLASPDLHVATQPSSGSAPVGDRVSASPGLPPEGSSATSVVFASKKDRWLAEKAARTTNGPAVARPSPRALAPVFAQNLRTREIAVLDGPGALPPERADRFFRCWFTGDHVDVPDVLVERVVLTARTFGVRHVKIVSSYRAPKYNLSLVKKGREVARDSEHTRGQAIDFQLVGVPVLEVYEHLLDVHPGGVGYYPVSEFVHVDIGRKRTWRGT